MGSGNRAFNGLHFRRLLLRADEQRGEAAEALRPIGHGEYCQVPADADRFDKFPDCEEPAR
jgi:hypothetical protein